MEVYTKPTICVLESLPGANDDYKKIRYYDGDMKSLSSISGWVEKYALKEEKEKDETIGDVKAKLNNKDRDRQSGFTFTDTF